MEYKNVNIGTLAFDIIRLIVKSGRAIVGRGDAVHCTPLAGGEARNGAVNTVIEPLGVV